MLFEEMVQLNRLPLDIMAAILPQIVNEEHVCKFLDINLNELGKLTLRVKLGQLYNSYIGLHTGHYAVDLKVSNQLNGARRLGAVCTSEGKACRLAGATVSQKGNYSNFRNEKLGVEFVDITGRWFTSTTSTKVLHFDYVSTSKPRKSVLPIQESRFERVIKSLDLECIRETWNIINEKVAQHEEAIAAMAASGVDPNDVPVDTGSAMPAKRKSLAEMALARLVVGANMPPIAIPGTTCTLNAYAFPQLLVETPFSVGAFP
jgi:hypothetical protein